jgi:hypothetical protein
MTTLPRPGEVYHVGAACGAPHGFRPILFRLIRVDEHQTHSDAAWLDGYEITPKGEAIERRSIYVILAGLRPAVRVLNPQHAETRNTRPKLPRQRITTTQRPTGRTR